MDYTIREGNYEKLGVQKKDDAVIFTFEGEKEENCSILFYGKKAEPVCKILVPEEYCRGSVRSVAVTGKLWKNLRYNYEINGKIITDTYATRIIGREKWNDKTRSEKDYFICGGAYPQAFDWENDRQPEIKRQQMVMYKLHVRGFSMEDTSCPRKERGTFRAITDKIPYLKKLGITTIELMPAYEFEEQVIPKKTVLPDYLKWESHGEDLIKPESVQPVEKINYWGYVPGNYFAPKASYSSSADAASEFRELVHTLHENGMECVMEFYFAPGMNQNVILDALRFWVREYHVDGFHLMGDGVHQKVLEQDPILYGTKKMFSEIAGNADTENMLAEYNAGFKQDMRRFLKSDEGMISGAEFHVRRNTGSFGTINYMANQDGFTLYDTVAYNYRHNEANGEDNRDGSEFNYSWNCGIEGATRKQAIRKMREQQMRNAFLMLLLSQGTPMIYGGDEFANSQAGNNNAWCQDNAVGWTDWKNAKKQENLSSFVKEAIAFRKKHPILHMPQEMRGVDYMAKGFPDISVHGERAWFLNRDNTSRLLGVMYCGSYAENENGNIYIGMNFHWEKRNIALPNLPDGLGWKKVADTSGQTPEQWFGEYEETYKKSIKINPRTIVVLIAKREESGHASMAALQDNNEA